VFQEEFVIIQEKVCWFFFLHRYNQTYVHPWVNGYGDSDAKKNGIHAVLRHALASVLCKILGNLSTN